MSFLFHRILPYLLANKLAVSVGFLGLLFFIGGLVNLVSITRDKPNQIPSKQDNTLQFASVKGDQTTQKKVYVDVSGAVVKPGVYELNSESRIKDALLSAGGMTEKADRLKVAQTLNLAAKLADGAKVYIPSLGDNQVTSQGGSNSVTQQVLDGNLSTLININQASENELDTLPGVGAVTAEKIIENRPYQTITELTQKKIVGASVFEKIKDKISVY